jgi:hypothetical protein
MHNIGLGVPWQRGDSSAIRTRDLLNLWKKTLRGVPDKMHLRVSDYRVDVQSKMIETSSWFRARCFKSSVQLEFPVQSFFLERLPDGKTTVLERFNLYSSDFD